jgi:hypothetical protein
MTDKQREIEELRRRIRELYDRSVAAIGEEKTRAIWEWVTWEPTSRND